MSVRDDKALEGLGTTHQGKNAYGQGKMKYGIKEELVALARLLWEDVKYQVPQ
jgi:hypothetical protein